MTANEQQIDGKHYRSAIQHWDYVAANDLDYFQAQITKYVTRWKKKGGLTDLKKAKHFLEKYIEINEKTKDSIAEIKKEYPEYPYPINECKAAKKYAESLGMQFPFGYDAKNELAAEDIFAKHYKDLPISI